MKREFHMEAEAQHSILAAPVHMLDAQTFSAPQNGNMVSSCNGNMETSDLNNSELQDDTSTENNAKEPSRTCRKFVCSTCGKDFRSKDRMQRHMNHHLGLKPFLCDICKQGFSSALALREHKARHDNQNLYECQTCGRGFKQSSALIRHQTTHSKALPYECKVCTKRFTLSSYLRSHMLSHTGERKHLCPSCGKTFIHLSDLNRHKLVHTGEKPFKCSICGSSFSDRSTQRRHERNHTMQKYQCTHCRMSFKCVSYLRSHLLKKHCEENNKPQKSVDLNGTGVMTCNDYPELEMGLDNKAISVITVDNNNEAACSGSMVVQTSTHAAAAILNNPPKEPSDCSSLNLQPNEAVNERNEIAQVEFNDVHILQHSFREFLSIPNHTDFVSLPDFESQEYYNWLSNFTSLCKLQPLPMERDIFRKINQVHKSITEVLAFPTGILTNVDNFKILMSIAYDLQKIIDSHIANILNQLSS